jgi:hypothetical protein
LAKIVFKPFLEKCEKNGKKYGHVFFIFLGFLKSYAVNRVNSSFLANLQKTFQFWTFLKCPKNRGPPGIKKIPKSPPY